jgi:hypothetical protein
MSMSLFWIRLKFTTPNAIHVKSLDTECALMSEVRCEPGEQRQASRVDHLG